MDEAQYLKDIDIRYDVVKIVRSEQRKRNACKSIHNIWKKPVHECLEALLPSKPSRNLLEELAGFATDCPNLPTAIEILKSSKAAWSWRSNTIDYIVVPDIQRARATYRTQQMRPRKVQRNDNLTDTSSGTKGGKPRKRRKPASKKAPRRVSRIQPVEILSPSTQSSPPTSPCSDLSSFIFETSDEEPTRENSAYDDVLQRFLPVNIDDFASKLVTELYRLLEGVPPHVWGEEYLRRTIRLLGIGKPATMYVEGVPPKIRLGLYTTASREDADVLSLDDDNASAVLAEGPANGKRVLIRNSEDQRGCPADEFLALIACYRSKDLDVQDPQYRVVSTRPGR